ncbi:MAG: CopG family transcriptional regulator [Symploca sp. SIO1B1]|nr:CopG family transcriptional regulator [Symploca sp. SIO1B1]
MNKPKLPKMTTDKEVESILEHDLSEYLEPEAFRENFTPTSFEFLPKDTTLNLRISTELLNTIKEFAQKRGIGYQKFVRQVLEKAVSGKVDTGF